MATLVEIIKSIGKFEIGYDLWPSLSKFVSEHRTTTSEKIDLVNFMLRLVITYFETYQIENLIYQLRDNDFPAALYSTVTITAFELGKFLSDRGLKYVKHRL